MDAGAEGSRGAECLHGHLRRYEDVYANQGEEFAILSYRYIRRSNSFPFFFF